MEFTGERYMPHVTNAQINYEHWHHYVFTKHYSGGKVVMDLACGEGYGSFYMDGYAARYVVKDIFPGAPMYFNAICPDAPLEEITASVLIDENATLHAELTNMIIASDHLVAALRSELYGLRQQLNGSKNEMDSRNAVAGTAPDNQMLQG
jgi:hypothetical protein